MEQVFAAIDGDVDDVAGAQGERAGHSCSYAYAAVAGKRDVGATSLFQQFIHDAKIAEYDWRDCLSLEMGEEGLRVKG